MVSSSDLDRLTTRLQQALQEYGYAQRETGALDGVTFVSRVLTPRRWMVRYLCGVLRVPPEVNSVPACKAFFEQARSCLTRRYARFPWWKELGTYLVLLCGHDLYQVLQGHEEQFKDRTGLHMNVMLGTCFVNVESLQSTADSSWGLHYSGKHFGAIREAVRQWCEMRTSVDNAEPGAGADTRP